VTSRLLRIKMAVAGVLGNVCAGCHLPIYWPWDPRRPDNAPSRDCLQVGHPNGRKWSIRKLNQQSRWLRYLREALANKVQAECGPCNRKHGGGLRYKRNRGSPRGGRS